LWLLQAMMRIVLLYIFACMFPLYLSSQITRATASHFPEPTAKGAGKIDTRIDNMGYWRRMADSGFVYVAPMAGVPSAVFTGSVIQSTMVTITDSPDIPTTGENSTQSENSVFINPVNNQSALNSNNSTQNPVGDMYGANYLLSADGGITWGGSINGAGGYNSGDPATAISLSGRQYINYIDIPGGQGISYSDDGEVWSISTIASNPGGLADKNHMWIDNKATSPYEGNLYAAWTDFGGPDFNDIKISNSVNEGVNWSMPINISSAVNAGSHNQGVNIQTGPGGEVYVAWAIYDSFPADETSIGFTKSIDGGSSFAGASRIISNIRGIRATETSKNQRVNSFPSMAVDISEGPHNGNIYIVWTNHGVPGTNTGDDIDIYMIRSTNGGTTWSAPVRVNQDPAGLGKQHYFPWITCDPITGYLSVIFYDDRNVSSAQCEVFVANSLNAGDSWEDFKVSDVAFTPEPIPYLAGGYMGDYLGISAVGGRVYPTWTDNRTGVTLTYTSPFDLSLVPAAFFEKSTGIPCINQIVQFQDMTMQNPTSWLWNFSPGTYTFANGTNATSQNPQVQFNAYGNYSVQLTATNSHGSDTLLLANDISVNNANAGFLVNFTKVIINNNVVFTDQSTCNISSYSWNFGEGATPATANTQGPHTVTYSSTGFKTISLTINGSVTKTITDYIEVFPEHFSMSNGTLATCSGVFYDPQGTSDYLDYLNVIMTIMPADTSKSIMAVFSDFALEPSCGCFFDWLNIYDGKSTSDSLLGSYCGISIPDTVVAYKPTGALTFQFHSDQFTDTLGWVATLSCVNTPPPSKAYCTANASTCDEYISRVQFGSIDNISGCSLCGYADYHDLFLKVSPGFSYPVIITNGNPLYPEDQCGIWIDWNRDHDFDDAGETVSVAGNPGIGPYSAVITPPVNAVKGFIRMRIRIIYFGDVSSCGTSDYGEVEDYAIYVGTPGLWVGGTTGSETNWNTANNWDDGRVPTAATTVIIPGGSEHFPEVAGVISCHALQIKDGASMNIQTGSVFNISGDLNVGQGGSGILIINGGTCNVTGNISALPGSTIDIINGGVMNDNN
jgi:PKD repeat protein